MPCQITLVGIQASPPYNNGDEPTAVTAVAKCTQDCQRVRVKLRATGAGSAIVGSALVDVNFTNAATAPDEFVGLITALFPLPAVGLKCGDLLFLEVTCQQDASCNASGSFPIQCKGAPGGSNGNGDNGNGNGNGNGGGGSWPPFRCLFTAAGAAIMLLAALACIAFGIGTLNAASIATGVGLIAAAAVAWALWAHWCGPGTCVRLGVLCWVFKRGFLAALPVVPFSTNVAIILVLIAYGSAAGICVHHLRRLSCPVPSAKLPLTQLPI